MSSVFQKAQHIGLSHQVRQTIASESERRIARIVLTEMKHLRREYEKMNYVKYLMLSAAFTLLIPDVSFAKSQDHGTMLLIQQAEIGSTQLQPGTYKVEWNGTGPDVHVNIMQHNKTVVSTTAQLKTNDKAASQNAVVIAPAANNGSKQQIAEIDFGKHNEALIFISNVANGNSHTMNRQ
jgi:hypothetical protein